MKLPKFEYLEPSTPDEAVAMLSRLGKKAKALAGGTDLLPKMKRRVTEAESLVNLQSISGLRSLVEEGDCIKIGALTTLGDMEGSPLLGGNLAPLAEAAKAVGASQLRNLATLGGNLFQDTRCLYYDHSHLFGQSVWEKCFKRGGELCHLIKKGKKCFAVYSSDVAPVLLALGAKVTVAGVDGKRLVDLKEIYSGRSDHPYSLKGEEIMTEVQIPKPSAASYGAYVKYRERGAIDFPIVGVAAYLTLEGETIKDAAIWVTSAGAAPAEAVKGAACLRGGTAAESLFAEAGNQASQEISPVPNHGYSAWYLKEMVKVFTKRACQQAWEAAKGEKR